jgi:hypothetical protein
MTDIKYKNDNEEIQKNCLSIIEKVQAAEIAEAKHNKCNRAITDDDKDKLTARRGIEIHQERKRLMAEFETL